MIVQKSKELKDSRIKKLSVDQVEGLEFILSCLPEERLTTLGSDPMKSGLQQRLQVANIELSPQTKKELDERFVLIYTGQRRLARNLLRDVVGRYVGNEPDSLFALEEIQKTAALMR